LGCTDTLSASLTSGAVTANFTALQTDCEGNYQLINNSVGADNYVWDIVGLAPSGLERTIFCTTRDTMFVYEFVPGTYRITLTANSDEGCVDSMEQIFTVYPQPVPIFMYQAEGCSTLVNFTNYSINGSTYSWNFGDPSTGVNNVSTSANPSHVFSANGIYPVTLIVTDAGGCSDTLTRNVRVNGTGSLPIANFTSSIESSACVTRVHFTNTSTNAYSYLWLFPDGSSNTQVNPSIAFPLAGTYSIRLIAFSETGCTDTIDQTVVINTNTYGAVAKFAVNDTIQCLQGNKFNFINQSLYYGAGYVGTYQWDFGDGTYNNTNTFVYDKTYSLPGTYMVRLIGISPSGCRDTAYHSVRVLPSADPTFIITIGCGQTAYIEHAVDTNATYVWNFGDGHFATHQLDSFAHTYANPGYYTITCTTYLDNGCTAVYTMGILASDGRIPTANFSYDTACANNIQFVNLAEWGSSFVWDFGDGSPLDSSYAPYHSYASAGVYNVSFTVYNSPTCRHTIVLPVYAPQGMGVRLPSTFMVYDVQPCTNIIQASDSATVDATNISWYLNGLLVGTGSNVNIPTSGPGFYELKMVADNGVCADTTWPAGIEIQEPPVASFATTTNACSNTILVNSTSVHANSFEWNFGDLLSPYNTAYGASASHTFSSNGTYSIRLLAFDIHGCADTAVAPITMTNANSLNLANFSYDNCLCHGDRCQNLVRFSNLTPGSGNTYLWSFGDGSTSSVVSPYKGFPSSGTFQVTLTSVDASGCMSAKTKDVYIDPSVHGPSASFTTDHQVQCENTNSYNFYNTSSHMNSGWNNRYYWYFGDGTFDTTNTFIYNKHYSSPGNYIVTLVAVTSEGCRDTMTMYVQVRALPCTGVLKYVNLQDGSNWNVDPKLGGGEALRIRVVDVLGKEVFSKDIDRLNSKDLNLDIEGLNDGTYMVILQSDKHQYRDQKFVVIH